jgi:hypothetical protein
VKNEIGQTCSTYGVEKGVYRVFVEKSEGKYHLENPGADGSLILRWLFRKWVGWTWTGLICLRIGTDGGHF